MATPEKQLQQGMNENLEIPKNQSDASNAKNITVPTQKDVKLWQVSHRLDPIKVKKYLANKKANEEIIFNVGPEKAKKLKKDPKFQQLTLEQQIEKTKKMSSEHYSNINNLGLDENKSSTDMYKYYQTHQHTWEDKDFTQFKQLYKQKKSLERSKQKQKIDLNTEAGRKQGVDLDNLEHYENAYDVFDGIENTVKFLFDADSTGQRTIPSGPLGISEDFKTLQRLIDEDLNVAGYESDTSAYKGNFDYKSVGRVHRAEAMDELLMKIFSNKSVVDEIIKNEGMYFNNEWVDFEISEDLEPGAITELAHRRIQQKLLTAKKTLRKIRPYIKKEIPLEEEIDPLGLGI